MSDDFEVWAITSSGQPEQCRFRGKEYAAVTEAMWIARQSGSAGAVSVWVVGSAGIVWAAGQKARDLEVDSA